MHDLLVTLTTWITSHPNLAGLAIFFSSFAESLAFVGLIMPGVAVMLTAGALIATGSLDSGCRNNPMMKTAFLPRTVLVLGMLSFLNDTASKGCRVTGFPTVILCFLL